MIERKLEKLNQGKDEFFENDEENKFLSSLGLLSIKPKIIVCNVDEDSASDGNKYSQQVEKMAAEQGAGTVVISAQIEEEISQLEDDEAELFLNEMGLSEAGLDRLIRAGYTVILSGISLAVTISSISGLTTVKTPPFFNPGASVSFIKSTAINRFTFEALLSLMRSRWVGKSLTTSRCTSLQITRTSSWPSTFKLKSVDRKRPAFNRFNKSLNGICIDTGSDPPPYTTPGTIPSRLA